MIGLAGCAGAVAEFPGDQGAATLGDQVCPVRETRTPSEIELLFRIRVRDNVVKPLVSADLSAADAGGAWARVFPDARLFSPDELTVTPPVVLALPFPSNWLSAHRLRLAVRATDARGATFLETPLECRVVPGALARIP